MHFSSMAGWLLAVCIGAVVAAGGVLEVDLVFPRNDTYAPSPWMPVVFAFQNAKLARFLNPSITYSIRNWDDILGPDGASFVHDLRWTNWSSSDPYFIYQYFDNFGIEGRWWLTWHVTWESCDEDSFSSETDGDMISNSSDWSILFTTKNSGKKQDLVAATANKTCPEELGVAINVTDKTMAVPEFVKWEGGDTCAVVASSTPTPTPNPCRVKIDSAMAANMSASLTARLCQGLNPPSDCPKKGDKNTAQKLVIVSVVCLAAALGAISFILM